MTQTKSLSIRSYRARRRQCSRRPPLRLTPYAWAKLLHLRDLGVTEVGGFGVSRPSDLLLVEDVHLVRQKCTPMTVKLDDPSVADYFDEEVDRGRTPAEFARIWIHTHPGDSPYPSCTDEETFDRCFGAADWAIMFIVARGGQTYARLRISAGPGGEMVLPVEIDFQRSFPAADPAAWEAEYLRTVSVEQEPSRNSPLAKFYDQMPPWADDYIRGLSDCGLESGPADLPPDLFGERCDA